MSMSKTVDPAEARAAVEKLASWLADPDTEPRPPRAELAQAVRTTARLLAQDAPGHSVEVRVPPFVAVQTIQGPRHTRGTPPNVVETDAWTWLQMATGRLSFAEAQAAGRLEVSGSRADEVGAWLPLFEIQKS